MIFTYTILIPTTKKKKKKEKEKKKVREGEKEGMQDYYPCNKSNIHDMIMILFEFNWQGCKLSTYILMYILLKQFVSATQHFARFSFQFLVVGTCRTKQ